MNGIKEHLTHCDYRHRSINLNLSERMSPGYFSKSVCDLCELVPFQVFGHVGECRSSAQFDQLFSSRDDFVNNDVDDRDASLPPARPVLLDQHDDPSSITDNRDSVPASLDASRSNGHQLPVVELLCWSQNVSANQTGPRNRTG